MNIVKSGLPSLFAHILDRADRQNDD